MAAAAQTPLPYFGRAFNVTVTPQNGGQQLTISSAAQTPTLRVQFAIETYMLQPIWQAKLVIYNLGNSQSGIVQGINGGSATNIAYQQSQSTNSSLTPLSIQSTLLMGDIVTISAGYQSTPSGSFSPLANLLYTGNLLQSISTRENVVDTKLTLRCITNLVANMFAQANTPMPANASAYAVLQAIGIPIANVDNSSLQKLQNNFFPRAQGIFQRPVDVLGEIAKQNNIIYWMTAQGLNMKTFDAVPTAATYVYGPPNLASGYNSSAVTSTTVIKPTLLGYPEGTQEGVLFRVLMDNQVKIGDVVQIAGGTAINSFQFSYGNYPPIPNAQAIYYVAGVRHVGDSRGHGEDWYTEITAMTPRFFQVAQAVNAPGSYTGLE